MSDIKYDGQVVVNAIYDTQVTPEFIGNPLIESLPYPIETKQIIEKVRYIPIFSQAEKNSSINNKLIAIDKIKRFRWPLEIYPSIQYNFDSLIRWCYETRNPLQKEETIRKLGLAEQRKKNNFSFGVNEQSEMMMITGDSGMGKSTAINSVLNMYPQVIIHSIYRGKPLIQTQIVWLKIDCPATGSLALLCQNFFRAIDGILGTNHLAQSGLSTRNADRMIFDMMALANNYSIGVLVIDEIQNLLRSKSEQEEVVNFLTGISNTVAMPLVLIGTTNAVNILSKFRLARRATSQADISWERMKKGNKDWKMLVEKNLVKLNIINDFTFTDEINDALYEYSQGITHVVTNLWRYTQANALIKNKEINAKLIKKTAEENMKNVSFIVKAIRHNDYRKLSKFEDLKTLLDKDEDMYSRSIRSRNAISEEYNSQISKQDFTEIDYINNLEVEILTLGICRNLTQNQIRIIVERIVKDNIHADFETISGLAIRSAIACNDGIQEIPKNAKLKPKREGLLEIHYNTEKSNVELLTEYGYIKDAEDL